MKHILSFILLFLWSILGSAQQPEDDVTYGEFQAKFLENLIYDSINNYRKSINLHPLKQDQILYLAAQDQATFNLKSNTKVGSVQPSKKKATPFDRVSFYGGLHKDVNEINERIFINIKTKVYGKKRRVKIKSYAAVADAVVRSWTYSKEGKKILDSPEFYNAGVAVKYNKKEKTIAVTQVLGSEPFQFPKNTDFTKLNYKIGPYSQAKCGELESTYPFLPELMSNNIFFKNNQIYFYFHDLALLEDVIKESNDGIAIDIISREQYSCNTGNRIHPSKVHKGILFPPIYKSQLFNRNELKAENEVQIPLGPIPSYVDTNNAEFNLLILKDDCLCETIMFNSLEGKNLRSINLSAYVDTASATPSIRDSSINTLEFVIPFQKNKSNYTDDDIRPFLDSLNLSLFHLKKIEVNAYSSIEGDPKKNKLLQVKRAESILNVIKKYNLSHVETSIHTEENWNGFHQSIKGSPYERMFASMDSNGIRSVVNSRGLPYTLEPYLSEQRYARVKLSVEKITIDSKWIYKLPKKINKAVSDKNYHTAKTYQTLLFSNVQSGKVPAKMLLNLEIPHQRKTLDLNSNQIAFNWMLQKNKNIDSVTTLALRAVKNQLTIDKNHPGLRYNAILFELILWSNNINRQKEPSLLLKSIKKLYGTPIKRQKVNTLLLNYYLIAADFYYENNLFREREKALNKVKTTLLQSNVNRTQVNEIIDYFIFQMRLDWAVDIMKPISNSEDVEEDFLFQFLKIAIYNQEKVTEQEYLEFMTKAKAKNKTRFCALFGFPNMSFQLLENRAVKQLYCQTCN